MRWKAFLVAAFIAALTGCGALPHLSWLHPAPATVPPILDRQKAVLVAIPADGGSAASWNVGSGAVVAYAVANAFSRRGVQVYVSEKQMTTDDVMAEARRLKAVYVVQSTIVLWDQHNEWLGWSSKLGIKVAVIDAATAHVISSASINGHVPFGSITIPSPDTLLAGPLSHYLEALY